LLPLFLAIFAAVAIVFFVLPVIPDEDLRLPLRLPVLSSTQNNRHPERSCSRHFVSNAAEGSLYFVFAFAFVAACSFLF